MRKIAISLLFALAAFSSVQAQSGSDRHESVRPGGPIVAASFNIRYNNPGDGVNAWPNRAGWVRELIRFHEWDIFGTQEGLRGQLDDLLEMDEFAQIGIGREDGVSKGEHSAIFYRKSRFELLDKGDFWLSETPEKPSLGWDAPSNIRICSWGKFRDKTSGTEFYFFCAHYDHIGRQARMESSKLIVKKIAEITGGAPAILTGDMNSTPDSDAYTVLDAAMRDSYKATLSPPYGPVGTFHGFNWDREVGDNRIDYIFTTPDIEVLKYGVLTDSCDKRYPSDHFPVMTKLLIK